MCGVSKYLKEQNSNIVTVGIDTYGSVFKKYKETGIFDEKEIYPYMTEGIGEDILPKNVDFDLIAHFVKVTDKDAAIMTRKLAREEGLFCGWSCGSAVAGALEWAGENMTDDDVMVIILPDHGTRYLGKVYNDSWMKDHGFLEERDYATAGDIIGGYSGDRKMLAIDIKTSVSEAVHQLTEANLSQAPVTEGGEFVGSLIDSKLLTQMISNPEIKEQPVAEVMEKPFQIVPKDTTLDVLASIINRDNPAVLVPDDNTGMRIITQHDVLKAVTEI
jgi:cystathionine beta-synthase